MTAPTLRPYLPADAQPLAQIFRAAIEVLTVDDYDDDQRAAWASRADDEDEFAQKLGSMLTLVASLEGAIAGFASLRGKDVIEMLYIHPEAVREGVATALIDALEKLAGARGATALVVEASDTANRFFLRRGYQPQQRNSRMVGDEWLANTTMIKKLGEAGGTKGTH
jgi:putative acetyltransferase